MKSNNNDIQNHPNTLTLRDVCDKYFETKHLKVWSDTTYKENREIINLLEDLLGKTTIFSSITRVDLTNATNKLVKLPANINKSKAYQDKSINQILLMNNVTPMPIGSINKYLNRISGLFNWAFLEGYISTNIVTNFSSGTNSNVGCSPFSISDLTTIFFPANFTKFDKAYKFWVPIIALYSGARLNEICQLHLNDIQNINGIDVFIIQSPQNMTSNRIVPIHSKILQLGLLYYIDFLKTKDQDRLFPELKYRAKGGYSDVVSKWFARYIKSIDVYVAKVKIFNSFRKTFTEHLKQKNVNDNYTAAIVGQTDESNTYGNYAQAHNPVVLKPYVEMISYNLQHPLFVIDPEKITNSWK